MSIFKKISSGFLGFCLRHAFNPKKIIVGAIILLSLLTVPPIIVARSTHMDSKTTKLTFENIGELSTQTAYVTNVQVLQNSQRLFGWEGWDIPLTYNKFIFSYDSAIKAGINFENIKFDLNDKDKKILVTLPEVEIFSHEIFEDSLKIYDETHNIFTPISLDELGAAREHMKEEGKNTAINNGLFLEARRNAEFLIRGYIAGTFDLNVYTLEFN